MWKPTGGERGEGEEGGADRAEMRRGALQRLEYRAYSNHPYASDVQYKCRTTKMTLFVKRARGVLVYPVRLPWKSPPY